MAYIPPAQPMISVSVLKKAVGHGPSASTPATQDVYGVAQISLMQPVRDLRVSQQMADMSLLLLFSRIQPCN